MSLTAEAVLDRLRTVPYPGFRRDIVAAGAVGDLRVEGTTVRLELRLAEADRADSGELQEAVRQALAALPEVERVEVRVAAPAGAPALRMAGARRSPAEAGGLDRGLVPDVRHVVAVASGKGGVGKSTVAVNLAVALARQGATVGLLDADIYGPSIPIMTGIRERPRLTAERKILPFERFGVRLMSLGALIDPEQAVIWRGPMVMKALEQLLGDTVWGTLDYLIADMPPGTGDAQLTMSQRVRLAGAVIVTTPQPVALADAIKGISMFRRVDVPVLGIVENMSYFLCPHCSERTDIFGSGGGMREAERLGVPCLGQVPLDAAIRESGDQGEPIVHARPDAPQSAAFLAIATKLREVLPPTGRPEPPSLLERLRGLGRRATE